MSDRATLLDQPVRRAVADMGIALLDAARVASGRLDDPDDAEALHDFRVALRRLRTMLRAFRIELDNAISKKLLRRLRDVTQSTGGTRDAEVQLAWIAAHRAALGKRPGPGVPWLVARLTARRDRGYAKARADAVQQFRRLERRLRRAMNAVLVQPGEGGSTLAMATAVQIRELISELEQEVAAARSPRDEDAIHSARIAGKRLRYLLEPIAGEAPQLGAVIKGLRQLQDLLGEMHDLQVLLADLGDAVAEAAAERARHLHHAAVRRGVERTSGPRPASAGLLSLARAARAAQDELFQRLESEWGSGQLASLTAELGAFALALAARVPPAPPVRLQPRRAPRPPAARPHRVSRRTRLASNTPPSEAV